MAAPTADQIREVLDQHVALWNAGDKEAWLAAWKSLVPGDVTMEDPVGTPTKRGWDVMADVWDASPNADWKLSIEKLYVCASTGAAVILNEGTVAGTPTVIESIEIYEFRDDGSLHTKTFWELADGNEYAQWTAETGEA
jgi:SnoaL-like domain